MDVSNKKGWNLERRENVIVRSIRQENWLMSLDMICYVAED